MGDSELIFQHDLAPPHTAKSTKEWFKKKRITFLDWPANCPNANSMYLPIVVKFAKLGMMLV